MTTAQYKAIAEKLIAEAFPQGDLDYMKTVVAADAVTHRAGFAALYGATGASIPEKGNLLEWVEKGWSQLQAALGAQTVAIHHVVAEGNQVMLQYHMTVLHQGDSAGAPATHKRVEWDEVSVITFGADAQNQRFMVYVRRNAAGDRNRLSFGAIKAISKTL